LTSRAKRRIYSSTWEVPMKSIANMSSFGAHAMSGTYLIRVRLVRPPVAAPGVSGKPHKRR
jgi:hypothetical protein